MGYNPVGTGMERMVALFATTTLQKPRERTGMAFLLALFAAIGIFLPFVIYDKGYFVFYGDFNVQQIPFYQMAHDAVREGDFFWSWTTDLGANFVGSYSFYLLGSPFSGLRWLSRARSCHFDGPAAYTKIRIVVPVCVPLSPPLSETRFRAAGRHTVRLFGLRYITYS